MTISFIPSQVGTSKQTPLAYTDDPLKLFTADLGLCFSKWAFVLGIMSPFHLGKKADPFDELYPSGKNIKSVILHIILVITQSLFLISLPFFILIPLIWGVAYLAGFYAFNSFICLLLNGRTITLEPNKKIVPLRRHDGEYWIYLNGVSVGRDWLQSNVDRLSMTFGRRVQGVHNPTSGIIFDLIECLIQRNLSYATDDIRVAYRCIKEALFNEHVKKVVFILHSQGGIEGGMIIDWLLAEMPQEYLSQLEVYTFGNAANHFNNPIRSTTHSMYVREQHDGKCPHQKKAIGHIEHYANMGDYVSQIGVLNYVTQKESNRFMGRVFLSPGSGHLLNQHYLHDMFVLTSEGKCAETNDFMDMPIDQVASLDGKDHEREGFGESVMWDGGEHGEKDARVIGDVDSPISPLTLSGGLNMTTSSGPVGGQQLKVKHLSRLWLYRNGGLPTDEHLNRAETF